jgi:hypothetical protein
VKASSWRASRSIVTVIEGSLLHVSQNALLGVMEASQTPPSANRVDG